MAVLSQAERDQVAADIQRDGRLGTLPNMTKADLKAAIAAVDDWVVANALTYNLALTLLARNNLSAAQKTMLLMYVVDRRFLSGE